ncbi:hypothetical protein MNBD_GAMMA24-1943 [hydrothermal vent metagenome]|uniref:Rhodanese domain-containing protein n=1 Tax=hydrothermal vent metagenome TaxID=652676 RepID=A0A3B1BLX2_9ZZZZ
MYRSINELDAPELAQRLDDQPDDIHVIDVREMNEFSNGTMPGAKAIPMATIPVRLNELQQDKELVIICRSGARSAQVCMFLQQQGFDKVFNLRGGLMSWARLGLPIEQPQAV